MDIMKDSLKFTAFLLITAGIFYVGWNYYQDQQGDVKETTHVSIYMVGSDLEEGGSLPQRLANPVSYGSEDLMELAGGLDSFGDWNKDDLEVFVGFGGANKKGWRGIKYADSACILADAEDEIFGNDDCYDFEDTEVNMSSQDIYTDFLKEAKKQSSGYERTMLINWDQGADYIGFGSDSNFKESVLSLDDMSQALKKSNSKYDVIGFDACLMGSIEVARAVEDYADYLLASEELEPSHGWQYNEVVKEVRDHNGKGTEALGKKLVDSFVDSKDHKQTFGKTLSLVDLRDKGCVPILGRVLSKEWLAIVNLLG